MATERAPSTPLVGRRRELDQLLAACGVTDVESRDVVLLGGDAGIGKTRLLRELSIRARDAGHRVLVGHCLDLGDSALPYQPFAEALASLSDDEREDLGGRFPALGPLLPWSAANPGTGVERAELFASVVAALDSVAVDQPLLLVIEDAHWADASTRHLIRYVLAQGFHGPVHLVVSYRADDLHRRHPLRQALAEWVRLPGARRLELEPLADADVAVLAQERVTGGLTNDELRAVVQRAAGNAFFVEELLDAGGDDHTAALPETLSDLLLVRLDRLDEPARRLVRAASVTDGREGFAALAAAAALTEDELDAALGSAVDHKVLRRTGTDDYGFRHALLGEALRDDLLPGERRRIHAAFLAALDDTAPSATVARHALAAGDRETAFAATVRAAEAAGRVAGYDEAARHYEQALALIDAAPAGTDEVDLVIDAANALVTSGELLRALELLRDHLAQLPDDVGRDGHGRLLVAIGNTTYYANLDGDAEEASIEAARVVPDEVTVLRAEVAALRSRTLAGRRRDDEAAAWGEQALAIAEQIGAEAVISDAKSTLTRLMVRSGEDPAKAKLAFRELIDGSRASGHVLGELRGLHQMAFVHFNDGELDEAEWAFAEAMRRAEQTGWAWGPYGFDGRFFGALLAYIRGRWDEALELCDVGPAAPSMMAAYLGAIASLVAAGRGDLGQIERTLPMRSIWRHEVASSVHSSAALIDLHGAAGDLAAARQTYDQLVELQTRAWDEPLFPGRVRLAALLAGQHAAAAPGLERSERAALLEHATELAASVEAVVGDNATFGPEGQAWRRRAHAEVARLRWVCGVDASSAAELVELWRGVHAAFIALDDPYESARSAARLAAVLLATGDDAEATALITSARAAAERLGARPLIDELDLLSPRAASTDVVLTPREHEVLQQVALGHSNGEIGTRLFISTKTVSVHVSNILGKLGASSRAEAAAIARRRGLLDA
ncbi:LuxR family transcriptional regulator [Aeromicrobium sp. Leaf350]|uniref:helix-turn-helix transcriptional regulator n=1 Tax=Aeromicrobium sp. Leaf350 TaxID=2876565 RepID=UPI001E4A1442|nr:LuxR family transcriptional regulator [Aeromicrobium sp. Leaf350]